MDNATAIGERMLNRGTGLPSLFYRVAGQGRPVVLVHGVGADGDSWGVIADRLARAFQVIWLDLRGHGKSGKITSAITLDSFVQDVLDVMDAEKIARADIVGFSLGGMIAHGLALDHPDRVDRLVIISAVAGRTTDERARVVQRLETLRTEGIGAITGAAQDRWFSAAFLAANPDLVRARMHQLRANDPDSYKAAYTVFSTSDLGDRLHGIRHKALIITGEHDVGSNTRMAEFMHAQIVGSALHVLPGLKHSVLVEAPELIAQLTADFLEGAQPRPP